MEEESPFENQHIKEIIQEIKELYQSGNSIEKAYYLYLRLGKIYKYRGDFKYRNHNTEEELNRKVAIYNEETSEKGEATCNRINLIYCKALNELGIKAECNSIEIAVKMKHIDVQFQDEYGFWYYADLTDDLMHIQTGMKTRSFGISLQQLNEKGKRAKLIIQYYSEKMQNENWSSISEESLIRLDEKFGHSYHGLYTNDVIKMLRNEFSDKNLIQEYFQTTDEDELLQRKLEFILNKIGIINKHSGNVGDVEAITYYEKILRNLFENEVNNQRIKFYKCFKEVNEKRQICDILVIIKNIKQIYYIFNNENQEYQRIEIEDLLNMLIFFHDKNNDKLSIQKLIERDNHLGEIENS